MEIPEHMKSKEKYYNLEGARYLRIASLGSWELLIRLDEQMLRDVATLYVTTKEILEELDLSPRQYARTRDSEEGGQLTPGVV